MSMPRIYLNVELADGQTHTNLRLLAADRIRAEKIARLNNTPWVDGPTCQAYLAFAITQRAEITHVDNFDQWLEQIADFQMSNTLDTGDDEEEDPTSERREV